MFYKHFAATRFLGRLLIQEAVGKTSLCTSLCSPCLRGASFLSNFNGDHGAYTEKSDSPDSLLKEASESNYLPFPRREEAVSEHQSGSDGILQFGLIS